MKFVIDANIVFSLVIKQGKTYELFFKRDLELFAPEFLLTELLKYENLILEKSGLSKEKFEEIIVKLKKNIIFVKEIDFLHLQKLAIEISPDIKDISYFALALYLDCPIWSNDKKLREQSKVIIYSTLDMTKLGGLLSVL